MKPLYKYLENQNALDAVNDGKFRVGTMFSYRDREKHGTERGDDQEGMMYWTTGKESFNGGQIPERLKLISGAPGAVVNIDECRFAENSSDRYVYCMSGQANLRLMKEFGCDSILRIDNPELFFAALTKSIRDITAVKPGFQLSPCEYVSGRALHHQSDVTIPAGLMKESSYAHQAEVRAIWTPISNGIKSIDVYCKEALDHCTLLGDAELKKLSGRREGKPAERTCSLYFGKVLRGEDVMLDNAVHKNCEFSACRIIYAGTGPVSLSRCKFDGCDLSLQGPAGRTIEFLKIIKSLNTQWVQDVLDHIVGTNKRAERKGE